MPAWLYGTFSLPLFSPDASMAIRLILLFVPYASEAIWHLCCVFSPKPLWLYGICCLFRLTPPRLYGICCLFVYLSLPDASAASGRFILSSPNASVAILALFVCLFVVCSSSQAPKAMELMLCVVSPDASVAIWHVLFLPEACAAIWLMLFILPNATVDKWHVMFMCCLSSPDACMAIWHILIAFVFA